MFARIAHPKLQIINLLHENGCIQTCMHNCLPTCLSPQVVQELKLEKNERSSVRQNACTDNIIAAIMLYISADDERLNLACLAGRGLPAPFEGSGHFQYAIVCQLTLPDGRASEMFLSSSGHPSRFAGNTNTIHRVSLGIHLHHEPLAEHRRRPPRKHALSACHRSDQGRTAPTDDRCVMPCNFMYSRDTGVQPCFTKSMHYLSHGPELWPKTVLMKRSHATDGQKIEWNSPIKTALLQSCIIYYTPRPTTRQCGAVRGLAPAARPGQTYSSSTYRSAAASISARSSNAVRYSPSRRRDCHFDDTGGEPPSKGTGGCHQMAASPTAILALGVHLPLVGVVRGACLRTSRRLRHWKTATNTHGKGGGS